MKITQKLFFTEHENLELSLCNLSTFLMIVAAVASKNIKLGYFRLFKTSNFQGLYF